MFGLNREGIEETVVMFGLPAVLTSSLSVVIPIPKPREPVYLRNNIDTYRLGSQRDVVVSINSDTAAYPASVNWRTNGQHRVQVLDLPAITEYGEDHSSWMLCKDSPTNSEPIAFLWPGAGPVSLILIAESPAGDCEVRAPIVYQLRGNRWQRMRTSPDTVAFTDRGSFFVRGNQLYVWDFADDPGFAMNTRQQYWLKIFRLQCGRLKLVSKRETKGRYPDIRGPRYMSGVPAEYDPLREFGLHWHWWGD